MCVFLDHLVLIVYTVLLLQDYVHGKVYMNFV